ncbi:beta-ketoacyl-[acyl-carrier-protein] synthase family protein [Xenorhabdus sp. XENO-10]|uniref:Beta-ketoacyl-[acyl-carrier-protein] synthase family protein n=1 Tax=Xenorhabdus yunnanensis TaxID=3025878 RepID=A0ABT5LDY1_9GAMM|nr:beta-ketoacyl-[acyl-carrier-protein] synthase family protein [Xenorhabdus yunnanensis]MDC9589164.1 beta-ketoacyl-[acyl-carrier-protein] synthase family protein [Xenorhabdus yunnanensis]
MIYISAVGMLNALGNNVDEIAQNLVLGQAPGMYERSGWLQPEKTCCLGGVDGELPAIPAALFKHNSRNNRLLLAALMQIKPQVDDAIARYGRERIAVIMGTSTSGLEEGDQHVSRTIYQQSSHQQPNQDYHYYQQELGDPSRFLASYLGIDGPEFTISTACSSSSRAIITGQRLIEMGVVDVAIVGGADTLSRMPINGFNSLESLSPTLCEPFGENRQGITIGEASTLLLLTREPQPSASQPIALLGVGESSDAWHMSAPHPEGKGAIEAINMALGNAKLSPAEIGYINLHGTGTKLNDQMESIVINQIFGENTPCSSTKYLTGHTLGAAGACEAGICWLLLSRNLPLPAQDFSRSNIDTSLSDCGLLTQSQPLEKPIVMSNSFAFGGNNTSLILGVA